MAGKKPIIGRGETADVRLTVENANDVKIELDFNRDGRFNDLVISATKVGNGSIMVVQGKEINFQPFSAHGKLLAQTGIDVAPGGLDWDETNRLVGLAEAVSLAPLPRGRR